MLPAVRIEPVLRRYSFAWAKTIGHTFQPNLYPMHFIVNFKMFKITLFEKIHKFGQQIPHLGRLNFHEKKIKELFKETLHQLLATTEIKMLLKLFL